MLTYTCPIYLLLLHQPKLMIKTPNCQKVRQSRTELWLAQTESKVTGIDQSTVASLEQSESKRTHASIHKYLRNQNNL